MCGPKFGSMEITQQVRDYAAKLAEKEAVSSSEAVDLARERGMAEMSENSAKWALRFMSRRSELACF
jgi:phosphomethylpyrimidine synthase